MWRVYIPTSHLGSAPNQTLKPTTAGCAAMLSDVLQAAHPSRG